MGITQSNTVQFQQNISNNIISSSQASCVATATTTDINNTIIVLDSEVSGDVGIITVQNVDASCVIGNTMDDTISNTISAAVQQENSALTGILGGLGDDVNQDNLIDVSQNISNNVTLILNSVCQSTNTVDVSNSLVYVDGSVVGQNVGIINTGGTSYASCTINNLSKLQLYNQATASAKQSNSDISLLSLIFIIIFLIVVLCALVALAKVFGRGKKSETVINNPAPVSSNTSTPSSVKSTT